jgi:hypothetical protein
MSCECNELLFLALSGDRDATVLARRRTASEVELGIEFIPHLDTITEKVCICILHNAPETRHTL